MSLLRAVLSAMTLLNYVDSSCFEAQVDSIPRLVLDKPIAATVDDCETTCLANANCLAISYDTTCSLLGNPLSGACGLPATIRIKKYANTCPLLPDYDVATKCPANECQAATQAPTVIACPFPTFRRLFLAGNIWDQRTTGDWSIACDTPTCSWIFSSDGGPMSQAQVEEIVGTPLTVGCGA